MAGALVEPVALQHVEHGEADRASSGSATCVVKNKNPRSCAACSISALVSTAASGRPAPSVLDRVRMSGTTPSRSKAYQVPVRHSPVWASSRISSMCRSWHLSARARESPGGGSMMPPELRIGSTMQAANTN